MNQAIKSTDLKRIIDELPQIDANEISLRVPLSNQEYDSIQKEFDIKF